MSVVKEDLRAGGTELADRPESVRREDNAP